MDITPLGFLLFVALGMIIYYCLPQNFKWPLLLVMSGIFYIYADYRNIFFILAFTCSSYFFGMAIEKKLTKLSENTTIQTEGGGGITLGVSPKVLVTLSIILDILILFFIKYVPAIIPINFSIHPKSKFLKLFMPIGISYYTLMSISYVLDVYWEKTKAEHNFLKLMLFTGYFPLLVQGPISKWEQLSGEFFKEHKFNFKNIKFGIQLMLWGFFLKLVVADRAGIYVNNAFGHDLPYGLNVLLGLILYGIQLYFDFSGGIDVVRGISECFDIKLIENFKQPYFSNSLGEFWRRWHISLGDWMKDYVFYPFTMSKICRSMKKGLKKIHISNKIATQISFAIADLLVFFLVGVWHGTGSKYLAWGMYNGFILAFSVLATPLYNKLKHVFHINDKSKVWLYFCIFRTLVIVTIGWVFDCGDTAREGIQLIVNLFEPAKDLINFDSDILILIFGVIIHFIVSLFHEKGMCIREQLNNKNFFVQLLLWTIILQLIIFFGATKNAGGFMYAQF